MNPESEVMQILYHQYLKTETDLSFNEWLTMKKKPISVVIIDPYTKDVYQTTIDGSLQSIYQEIGDGCEVFEVINIDSFVDLYMDEELKIWNAPPWNGFLIGNLKNAFYGRAIVAGRNRHGEMISCPFSPEGVLKMLKAWVVAGTDHHGIHEYKSRTQI